MYINMGFYKEKDIERQNKELEREAERLEIPSHINKKDFDKEWVIVSKIKLDEILIHYLDIVYNTKRKNYYLFQGNKTLAILNFSIFNTLSVLSGEDLKSEYKNEDKINNTCIECGKIVDEKMGSVFKFGYVCSDCREKVIFGLKQDERTLRDM